MSKSVLYRPFDGSDGLQSTGKDLVVWRDEKEVGRVALAQEEDLPNLLASFRAVELLPQLSFCLVPEERILDIGLDLTHQIDSAVVGTISYDNIVEPWEAECVSSSVFINPPLPLGARPWAAGDEPGEGWRISLPRTFTNSPDTVLCQRVGLAVEIFLYALNLDRPLPLPYRRRVSNVFSASDPTWSYPVPLIASMERA